MEQLFKDHWGDLASALGLVFALIGFSVTIVQVRRAASAAERAKEAADSVRARMYHFDLLQHLTQLSHVLDEIKRLQGIPAWGVLPDRYAMARRLVILIRKAPFGFAETHLAELTRLVAQLSALETSVDRSNTTSARRPSQTRLNRIVQQYSDSISEIVADVRHAMEAAHE